MSFKKAAVVVSLAIVAGTAYAAPGPVAGQGVWDDAGRLLGRDAAGNPTALLVGGSVNPALKFVFDPVADVTWLAAWSGTDKKNWTDANAWAAGLGDYGLTWKAGSSWALPAIVDLDDGGVDYVAGCDFGADCGYDVYDSTTRVSNSLLAYMYYDVLGNTKSTGAGGGLENTGPFTGVVPGVFWSSTPLNTAVLDNNAWVFDYAGGQQGHDFINKEFGYVAVRQGDVAPIPEPGSVAMMLAGLAALGAVYRRRRN